MMLHHQVDQLNVDIAIWKLRRDNWIFWASQAPRPSFAYRSAVICQDKIDELRRSREALAAIDAAKAKGGG